MVKRKVDKSASPDFHAAAVNCKPLLKDTPRLSKKKKRNTLAEGLHFYFFNVLYWSCASEVCMGEDPSCGSSLHDLSVSGQVLHFEFFFTTILRNEDFCTALFRREWRSLNWSS
jgi:hypothetical protein